MEKLSDISNVVNYSKVANVVNEVANVKDYGAVGDGVTDDTNALNACFQSNNFCFIPKGTYVVTAPLNVNKDGFRLEGEGVDTILKVTNDIQLFYTTYAIKLLNFQIVLDSTQTQTVIFFDMNRGTAYQMNSIDVSNINIRGNNADCYGIYFQATNGSYMSYNHMENISIVAEGVQKGCLVFDTDTGSGSYIRGNSFDNVVLTGGGIKYFNNGVEASDDDTSIRGNVFTGIYQTRAGIIWDLKGINIAPFWDAAGNGNLSFKKYFVGLGDLETFNELNGDDKWTLLTPQTFVLDGWTKRVNKLSCISSGSSSLEEKPKAMRGLKQIIDPCINAFDNRFLLVGVKQQGNVRAKNSTYRNYVALITNVTGTDDAYLELPNTGCTLDKYPELNISFDKYINGFSGGSTPTEYNPRLDAKIGLISDDNNNGIYIYLEAVSGDVQQSNVRFCKLIGGTETVISTPFVLNQNDTMFLQIYTTDNNVVMKVTRNDYTNYFGAYLAENSSYGQTHTETILLADLFDKKTILLNPIFKFVSTDKEVDRAQYFIQAIEYNQADF